MEAGLVDPGTPPDVVVTTEARQPVIDSTLGVPVELPAPAGDPPNRLVALGDSLTHGMTSFAVHHTENSYPAMIARELGWRDFRYPAYDDSPGGLPLDLEWFIRKLEPTFGDKLDLNEAVSAGLAARKLLEEQEDYWERGAGSQIAREATIKHNLAIYGWDLRDVLSRDADTAHDELAVAADKLAPSLPQNSGALASLRVLESARDAGGRALTPLEAAVQLGEEGDGIETLIVFVGSNNALPTVLTLDVTWSRLDYANIGAKEAYTVWRPIHFATELGAVSEAVAKIRARHVLWLTIPHVTIAPIARGFGEKLSGTSRYFQYYARPWLDEATFLADPSKYPHLTAPQVRAVDSAHVVDISGVLDRMAARRYFDDPGAQPPWWTKYEMPTPLTDALGFEPTTQFLLSGPEGIKAGGVVGLDGVHPTTVGYSLIAHECMKVMKQIGVKFYDEAGEERVDPDVDFDRVARADTLLSNPLRSGIGTMDLLGKLDERFALLGRFEQVARRKRKQA